MTAFDLDDTLAPSKAPLPDPVREALLALLTVSDVCVISGGQIEQFRTQVVERLGQLPDDLAVRLHLDGVQRLEQCPDVRTALASVPAGPVDLVANYTAFQDARKALARARR